MCPTTLTLAAAVTTLTLAIVPQAVSPQAATTSNPTAAANLARGFKAPANATKRTCASATDPRIGWPPVRR